jgi:nucleoside-diphosphate-sugar epimerase
LPLVDRRYELSNSKVLVTGASGFIGSHVCRRLLAAGAEVHGVYRTAPANDSGDVHWWQVDVCDAMAVRRLVANLKPDRVFHLASFVSGNRNLDAVLPALHSNLVSTVNLLAAVTEIGCQRIVLAGSLEEPEPGDGLPVPSSPYAAAKFAASAYARMFHALYRTPVVNTRIFMVYGPGQRDLRKLVPYVTLSLLRKQTPKLSSGARLVDWVYVEDVVDGLLAAAVASEAIGCTVDLGSGTFVSVRDVASQLAKIVDPNVQLVFGDVPDRAMEQVRLANVAETQARLGWTPSVSLEEGLRRTVAWYTVWLRDGAFVKGEG